MDLPFSFLPYLVPVFMVMFFPLTIFMISRFGWKTLADRYALDRPFDGTRIGVITATINKANYNGSLVMKTNSEGFYLRPILFFRLFHPALFIPWSEISNISEQKVLFSRIVSLTVGNPTIATIKFTARTFARFEQFIPERINGRRGGVRDRF